jgi:multidrug efflux system membrane fusion protein
VLSPPLRKGTFVEKDQILCQLAAGARSSAVSEAHARLAEAKARKVEAESRILEKQARVAEAKARLEEALVKLKIATSLSEGGFASDTRVKNAQAVNASAQAALEAARSGVIGAKSGIESAAASIESAAAAITAAEIEFERLVIDAPFAGLLESDTAELGSLLQQGSLCATIIQLNPIKLIAYAPETEVNRIAIGAPAKAELAAGGGTVNGVVTFLSRSSDPETRTFLVEIEVPNSNLEIRDGQTAEIIISAAGAQAHLLPSSALTLNQEGQIGLRTLSASNKVSFTPVTVMRDTTQGVWLTGLPDEVSVIVVGQEFVTAGVTVIPTYTEQTK